jgi:hypothetical protein
MKNTLVILIVTIFVLAGAGWGLYAAFVSRFQPVPVAAKLPAPKDQAEAMRQDLEVLGQLPNFDHAFTIDGMTKFERERQKLIANAGTLTPQALEMEVSRLVALAENGHTTVGRRLRRLHRVAVRMVWFEEGLFIVRTAEAHANLLGAQVVRINGKTPQELLAALTPYVSGPKEHAKDTSPMFLESPTALSGVWPEMDAKTMKVEARTAQGATLTATLEATAPDPKTRYVGPERNLAPQRIKTEKEPWRNLLAARQDLPLVLREPDASLFVQKLDEGAGLYIHINEVMGDERGSLSDQLAAVVDALGPASLRYAILDLRFNGGGDYTNTLRFTKELPKRIAPDGKLFILTDNATFSAALVTMARAKHFGGARSVVLGERVGDRERFWAEAGAPIELPNSKIHVFFATGYHDWNEGCGWKDVTRCFWLNLPFDVPAGDLAPKHLQAWRFADYRNGVDTVMEDALRQARAIAKAGDATGK